MLLIDTISQNIDFFFEILSKIVVKKLESMHIYGDSFS